MVLLWSFGVSQKGLLSRKEKTNKDSHNLSFKGGLNKNSVMTEKDSLDELYNLLDDADISNNYPMWDWKWFIASIIIGLSLFIYLY